MDNLIQDLRYGARRLLRAPGFTLIAVLTLALGIGANSAIFSVVNAVLLRPLPYEGGDRIARVFHVGDDGKRNIMSPGNFRDVREQVKTFESLSFFQNASPTLTGRGEPEQLDAARVGQDFFDVFRVKPTLGRTFRPEENEPGRDRVVVLSEAFWRDRFGADASIVGKTVTLDAEPYEVVGVVPADFDYPASPALWLPYRYDANYFADWSRGAWSISAVGRLRDGATHEEAARAVKALGDRLSGEYPETNTDLTFTSLPLYEVVVGDVRPALVILLASVGLVLLIACANVANLLLARAAARESELAVRTALGAGRARLVRQMVTESVILAALGGAAGLLLAVWGTSLLVALAPDVLPRLGDVAVDPTVVGFTLIVSLLAGFLFGLAPAIQVTRGNLANSIRAGGRGALNGRGGARVRSGLVVAEMALSVMLLASAGLLIRSFVELQSVDPGFRSEGVVTFGISLPRASYEEDAARVAFQDRMLERLRALPGVRGAAALSDLPLRPGLTYLSFDILGREPAQPGNEYMAQILRATPDYFRTMGIPLRRGRVVESGDRPNSPPVVVINEEAVRRLFPDVDPLGQRIVMAVGGDTVAKQWEVVGVVGDVNGQGLAAERLPAAYFPAAQAPAGQMDYVVSTSVPPMSLANAIRREVHAIDPNLPVTDLQPVGRLVSESISQPRFYTLLLSIFAGVALLLAAIGIFGVVSYGVSQRTREFGVRMALGAHPGAILRRTVGGALLLGGAGVGAGLVAALAGTQLLDKLLFGVGTSDPLTFASVAAILLSVAALASYLPARRATRVDPMVALRSE